MSADTEGNVDEIYTIDDNTYDVFIEQHKSQLISNNIPSNFWKPLCVKLKNQIFDAGNVFSMIYLQTETSNEDSEQLLNVVLSTDSFDYDDGNNIYLIDHAWTYSVHEAKSHLTNVPGLAERMAKLMHLSFSSDNMVEVDDVCKFMWKFNLTYSCSLSMNVEDHLPVWYVMDEFGSAIQHSDNPNFRIVPLLHLSEGMAYSLLFPIQAVKKGDFVTRDYVEGTVSPIERKAKLLPWVYNSLRDICFVQEEPPENYFLSGRSNESLPNIEALIPKESNGIALDTTALKVFSQYTFINEYLTSPKFLIVVEEEEADILWFTSHFKQFKEFSETYPSKFVNQFPFECVLTIKDLLAIICRRKTNSDCDFGYEQNENYPSWLPITYNLITELPKFVSYFQYRQERGLNNNWICKPWNLARGMDTIITDNLDCIVRVSSSGPKIVQKYIENPVLFFRDGIGDVKFDIRYVVLLKSLQPLEFYVYKNFFLRFANKPFQLTNFEDYETHFTVMNYNENTDLHRLLCVDFIREFDMQNPDNKWSTIEHKILTMFSQVFECATKKDPPCGIGKSPQSRALYAADLMLSKVENGEFVPQLLEVNWTPDCHRACEYYPNFFNDIFELLFFDEDKDMFYRLW